MTRIRPKGLTLASANASYAPLAVGQSRMLILPGSSPSGSSGTWIYGGGGSSQVIGNSYVSSAAETDYLDFTGSLRAGTYTLSVNVIYGTAQGILQVKLDGNALATTVDMYAGSTANNQITRITGVAVATSGSHVWRFGCPTKNASSSSYRFQWSMIEIVRTGD